MPELGSTYEINYHGMVTRRVSEGLDHLSFRLNRVGLFLRAALDSFSPVLRGEGREMAGDEGPAIRTNFRAR